MYMQTLRSSRPTSCDFGLSLAVNVWLYEAWLLLVALLFSYSHALQSHIYVCSLCCVFVVCGNSQIQKEHKVSEAIIMNVYLLNIYYIFYRISFLLF